MDVIYFKLFFIKPCGAWVLERTQTHKNCVKKNGMVLENRVYVEKYLNIAILFRIFPPVSEMISQIQSDPFPLCYDIYSKI